MRTIVLLALGACSHCYIIQSISPATTCRMKSRINWRIQSDSRELLNKHSNRNQEMSSMTLRYSAFPDPSILPQFQQGLATNLVLGSLLFMSKQKSLTTQGLLHSTILGIGLWSFLGINGWVLCVSYLILGSIVTKIRMAEKEVSDCRVFTVTSYLTYMY